jgi:DMSO/TMAO reductase YedYZ molybdopterin-dependent catalytic subunit
VTQTAAPRTADPIAEPELSRGFAALIGVLAVAAAIGAGQLVAGILSPPSGPFLAVGDATVRVSPQPLVEFAKSAFGTADKIVLLIGMGVVIVALAAAAGLASRRRPTVGIAMVLAMGALAFVSVITAPTFSPLDLAAPAASAVIGLVVLRRLHEMGLRAAEAPTPKEGITRRRMLVSTSTVIGTGAVVATGLGSWIGRDVSGAREDVTNLLRGLQLTERAPAIPASAAFPESPTPFITSNADFYRIDTALRVPMLSSVDWRLRIGGLVDNELELTFDDLVNRPLVERTITMLCVSNPVGGPYISTTNFIGVDLREILLEAGIRRPADQLFSTSIDGWTCGTPLDVLLEPGRGALLAIGMNGEALPAEHGFPVRMVVPGLYGFVSATKWVTDMEVTTFADRQAYWLERGWAEKSPIKTESRIDFPNYGARVPAGRTTVAGIAWSQPIGISAVEVSLDDTGVWQPAALATEVNTVTWRQWRATLDVPPGQHIVRVRATDRNGVTQTETEQDVVPDGATGWHTVTFTAA